MTSILDDATVADPPDWVSSARRSHTIDSYDQNAAHHAQRLAQADFENYLQQFRSHIPADATVLDGGCGGGRDLRWMTDHGLTAIGLDLSEGMLEQARVAAPDAQLLHGDLCQIPLPDNAVDGVWLCASVLHLDPQQAAVAFAEVARILKSGGAMFVSTAAGRGSNWRRSPQGARWFQLYTREGLVHLLTQAGLEVVHSIAEPGVVHGEWINATAIKR